MANKNPPSGNDPYELRKRLTFEQAEGVEPLPEQLKLKELSQQLRSALWRVVYGSLVAARETPGIGGGPYVSIPWSTILRDMHTFRYHRMEDEFNNKFKVVVDETKAVFAEGDYLAVLGWLQWVFRRQACPSQFPQQIDAALRFGHAAYRLVDRTTIVPVGSDAELATLKRAFADVGTTEFQGARAHLRNAAEELTGGRYADSVRESIHAVESVVRVLEPSGDFSKALAKLESKVKIHGALKRGFSSIYGFTSDQEGIRHALLEAGAPAVDETDALFMIGACAAFVSYLINKSRNAGLLASKRTAQ
jgi:hypothetical protein